MDYHTKQDKIVGKLNLSLANCKHISQIKIFVKSRKLNSSSKFNAGFKYECYAHIQHT